MSELHVQGIHKTRKIIGYVLSFLPSALIVFSGINKILGVEWMLQSMERIGIAELTPYIGALEIFCVILYWIPKTSNIGFFLLCSYAGGIIVGELIIGGMPIPGLIVAVLLYVGTMLRKPYLSGLNI